MRITPYKIVKAWRYLRHFGPKAFWAHLLDRIDYSKSTYDEWYREHRPDERRLSALREKNRPGDPLISVIVPAYETPEKYLREMIASVRAQTYENWELCVADASDRTDRVREVLLSEGAVPAEEASGTGEERCGRILFVRLPENAGIAENTNAACAAASGEYLGFMDHDDVLAPHALRCMADAHLAGADMAYSDEDKVTEDLSEHLQPNLKPEYNEDLLRSNNYITHFLTVSRALFDRAGRFRAGYDGAQDYDLIFRCAEKAEKIVRVPEILYHWRTHATSTSDNPESKLYAYEAGKRAIEDHLRRTGEEGSVTMLPEYGFYRVKYPVRGNPSVSVIIPNRDEAKALSACLRALAESEYPVREILIVENGSKDPATFALYEEAAKDPKVRILRWEKGFNYSAINNFAAREASGDYILFLNNDVRTVISRGWLTEMLGTACRPDVGIVGAKLYYPDDHVQHAGCVVGIGGIAGALFTDLPRARKGYLNKASIMQDLSAVTAAMMLIRADVFREAGGFTETLAIAFNDIDLCLKVREMGYLVVFDPFAEAYHDESRTRGDEDTEEKRRRFQTEIEYMRTRWHRILVEGDPYYNPNLSLQKWNYSLKK